MCISKLKNYIIAQQKGQSNKFKTSINMIQGMIYPPSYQDTYSQQAYQQQNIDENIESMNQLSTQLKNSSKKHNHQLKYIKQLKSKDIKLRFTSHKKINIALHKVNSNIRHGSSFQYDKQILANESSPETKVIQSNQIKKSVKPKKSQNSQKVKQKQKSIEVISKINPQSILFSKQGLTLNRQKYSKKLKVSQLSNLQQRVRQSRSQNKRQKINNNNINTHSKNINKNSYDQSNIFQSLDIFAKQNSHHSLDKNQQVIYTYDKGIVPMTSKIEEKLHLPSLVSNSGLKNAKSKIQQNINLANQHNQTEIQKSHFYPQGVSKTQKSSPYISKIVKIPIEKLKPLKPQQIKLKYQQKVKQEQKNRAKQRAIQIFEKQEEQASKRKKLNQNKVHQEQSDQNSFINQIENKKLDSKQSNQLINKTALIKQEKFNLNRGQNIFKKKLITYNGGQY